jgi:hypothetical protein
MSSKTNVKAELKPLGRWNTIVVSSIRQTHLLQFAPGSMR